MPRPIPEPAAGRNEISGAAHAVLDVLDENQTSWADHESWECQINIAKGLAENADRLVDAERPLAEIRMFAIHAAARLIDAIGEIDRCVAAGEA